jgi:hypothetical protein
MKNAKKIWYMSELLGNGGGVLILYSLLAQFTEVWRPIEQVASFVSSFLTVLGTLLTAATVYFPVITRPPWQHSKEFYAPIVMVACVAALVGLCVFGTLPAVMVNGFAMLAIAGALKRSIPYPEDPTLKATTSPTQP